MPMYNWIECCDNFWETSKELWQYYRDKPTGNNGFIVDFDNYWSI